MDKYRHQPQHESHKVADCRRRKSPFEDDPRRSAPYKKMRSHKEQENVNNNDNSNSTSSFIQPAQGSSRRSRSPGSGLDPLTSNVQKTLLPKLPPPRYSNVVNWRLACFMAREYLSSGTLLGKPWPPQDSNTLPREDTIAKSKQKPKPKPNPPQGEQTVREKEGLYTILTTDFLRSDDVHIPGILNPSQLASWLGFK